jgi:hypothetical protein
VFISFQNIISISLSAGNNDKLEQTPRILAGNNLFSEQESEKVN